MKYSNTIEYNINTKLDSSGLTKLQAQIKQLENSMQQMANRELLNSDKVQAAKSQLEGLNTALTNSFNSSLGILDLSKFRTELDSSGVSAKSLQSAFNMMGAEGQSALNSLTTQIANFNGGMERTSSQIDKIFTTFSNTFRWGLVSSFFSQFTNAIHSSVDYVKELDDSLTQIMLVTDYNRDSMNQFAKSANEAAKAVSMTTTGMTNASLIFAQQGYDLGKSQELATLSAKLANASQQDTATTSDQITAYMNAYGLQNSIEELTQQMDNWALIANVSAADVGELAQASQRAASMANAVGVSGEALAAQIATIESVTREAPEQIGNGLKTLYARFSDIKLGKTDEDGIDLGKVTETLDKIGVDVLDQFGNIREMDNILEDLMDVWADLDDTTKLAAGQALAGKYQINRFYALMDNRDMYEEYVGATGSAATGTLDQMNEEYADSIPGRTAKLQASLEGLFSTVFNTDDIYPWMDAAQGAVDLLQQFFDALGGGKTVLLGITSLLTQVFSQNIARSINDTLANRELMQTRQRNIEGVNDTLDRVGIDRNSGIGQYISATAEQAGKGAINDAQYDTYMANVQNWINAQTALTQSEEELQDTIVALNMAYGKAVSENNAIFKDPETGAYNTQFAQDERANLDQDQINKIMKQADFSEAIAGAKNYSISLQQLQALQEKYNGSAENSKQMMSQIAVASDQAQIALEQLYNTGVISDEMFENMQVAIEQTVETLKDDGEITEQTEKQLNDLISAMTRFSKMAENMDASQLKKILLGGVDEFRKKENAVTFNQAQVDRADENAQKSQQNVSNQQNIKEILDTFNAVQQLTFAWQAFQNLGSLWANEDLSTGEKILQTIMNLTMAMPQLIGAMQTLQNNSFLQNIGNDLLNILGPGSNFSDMASSVSTFQSFIQQGEEAQQVVDELQYKVDLAKQAMELREGLQNKIEEAGKAGSILQSDKAKSMSMEELQSLSEQANKMSEYKKTLDEVKEATEGIIETGKEAGEALQANGEMLKNTAKNGQEASQALNQMPGLFTKMYAASLAAGGGITGFKAALDVAKTSMLEFLSVSGPFLAIGLAIGAVAFAIGQTQEQAKEAHEQVMADFEEAKNAQQQAEEFSTKANDWKSKRQSGGDNKELAKDADALADSLRELGKEEEANAIHLAAIHAENDGTTESFNKLEDAIDAANHSMSDQSALDAMNAANAILKDRLSTTEEIAAAQEALQSAALDYNLSQASKTHGEQMGVLGVAGDEDLHAATMDWHTLNSVLEQSVPGFKEITDENERLSLALSHTSDEAQRAAIEIQQVLNANENLNGSARETGGVLNQRDSITQLLEESGLSAEESLQLLVTVDDSSYKTMTQDIQTVMSHVNDGEPFDIAIQAIMDEEETEDYIKGQIAAWEPEEDLSKKDKASAIAQFQGIADTFYENKDQMGVEGTPFEDYSEDILKNADALEEVIEGILHYNDAIESIDKNMDNWKDALENTGELSEEHITAVNDLQDAYGDFLDLSKRVSKNFASNTENLELLKEAAEGDTKAFEDLEDAAAADIYMQISGVDDLDVAQQKIEEINKTLSESGIEEIPIGEIFNLDDFDSVRSQIDSEIQALGLNAEQAAQYVSDVWHLDIPADQFTVIDEDMDAATVNAETAANAVKDTVQGVTRAVIENSDFSVSTDIDSDTAEATDTVTYTNLIPVSTGPETITSMMPVGNGNSGVGNGVTMEPFEATVYGVGYEPDERTATQIKQQTGFKEDVKAEQGGGGGHVGLPSGSGAQGSRRPSGGTGRSGASRPSGGRTGGGGKGKSCFVAGTLITTLTGFKPIEKIQKGDIVLSYNEKIKVNEYSEVLQIMIHDTIEPIYTLHIKDEQLRVTGIHRFLAIDKITCGIPQWVHATDLKVGNWVMFADGSWHVIHKINIDIEHRTVYNFEVSHNHNYYVGRNQILAHNKGGGGKKSCFVAGTQVSTSLGFKAIETIQPDDVVLSYNEQTGHNEYSSVIQTMIHDTIEPIYTLYIQNEKLRVTGIHRFFITKNILTSTPQWIVAEKLKVGDWVLLADGTWHVIWKIEVNIEHQTVYNFEVSGNHNYYVGYNQILAHNKGGGKQKEIKSKEKKEHEKDYYEEVNTQLDKTEKMLSKIEKEEDRLIGDKARANQNKQISYLKKQYQLLSDKKDIQEQELKDVDALLKKREKEARNLAMKNHVKFDIPEAVYDGEGAIANYEEMSAAIDKIHNQLIDKYNKAAKAGNEKTTKALEETISKFDKYGEDILKNAKRHDKLQVELQDTENQLEEINNQIEDIRIEAYKAAQEALDNLKEIKESAAELDKLFRDFDPNSFMNKFSIDDTPYGDLTESLSKLDNMYSIAKEDANDFYQNLINQKRDAFNKTSDVDEQKAILSSIKFFEEQQSKLTNGANLENGLLGLAQQDLARLQEWIDNPAAEDNPFGKNEAALFEAYQDAYKRTLDYFKDYRELIQDTRDSIIDIYDDASDAIERQIDQFDRLIEKTERISDTYTLYYGEDSYDQLDKFYAQQGNIMQNQLDQLTAAYNYWQEQYQKALQTGDKKFIQEMKDRADEAEDAMLDAAQELAELWVEKFENAVEASSQHIYKNLFGSNDIDELADNWELQKDYMERYKDDVEKAYEIEKLRNKYLDLLDEAQGSSLQTQNKIRQQMQEQLDLLQNETTMSEYDVKLANAKLEILQKQMALEDAQRNKNKMQLRRDTQGNYRYVYTADQGDVRQAQQDLEDSEYDAYEMTKEETVANNDRAINLLQDYIEKRAAIWNKYKDDATARGQALAELEAEYEKIFLTLAEDFTDTSEGMYDILNWLVKNGSEDTTTAAINMLDTLYDKNGEIKEKTGQDWADMASFISNQVLPNIGEAVTRANLEMEDQATELKDAMVGSDGVLTKIGSGADDVKDSMDKAADATRLLANATDELFTAFGADDGKLQKALDKLAQYEQQLQNTQKTTSNLAGQLKQANQTIAAKNAEALHYQTTLDLLTGARNFKKGDTVTLKKGTWVWYARDEKQRDDKGNHGFALPEDTEIKIGSVEEKDSDGKLSKHHIGMRPTDTKVWGKPVADDPRKGGSTSNRKQQVWHLNSDEIIKAMKYDTGGYTGKWQDQTEDVKNGKLAVLHQKELILNATDTENILAAVTLMRDMTKGSILGLSNIGKIIPTGLSSNVYGSTTEQRVEIQASFPNATDAEDIRAALLGLSDSAYQYAHRTI